MNVQQYEAALHWIYDKLEATANNPEPTIRWLGEEWNGSVVSETPENHVRCWSET